MRSPFMLCIVCYTRCSLFIVGAESGERREKVRRVTLALFTSFILSQNFAIDVAFASLFHFSSEVGATRSHSSNYIKVATAGVQE